MNAANNIQRFTTPAVVFLIGAPLCIFIHECAHYGAAIAFGCDARLYAMHVKFTGTFEDQKAADTANLLITLAGPSVQIISVLVGASGLSVHVRSVKQSNSNSTVFWILSMLTFSGLRWLQAPWRGHASDEATIASLLGYPWYSLPVALFVVSLAICVFLGWVHHLTNSSIPLLAAIPAGIVGAALWAFAIGPALVGV